MLTVKPIQTKQEQEFFASKCNIPYDEDMMAYAAYEEEKFLGMCQFAIKGECGFIKNIAPATDVDDFEAMFIMGRGTMNFIDLCGVHIARCEKNAGDGRLLTAMGFKDVDEELLFVDMNGMFTGGACTSHEKNN